ncbi:hypothetical protein V6758_04680 [Corynebacterium kalidii]
MRSREVWIHAVDLDTGAGFGDIPGPVLRTLLTEIPARSRSTAGRQRPPCPDSSAGPRDATPPG